MIKHHLLIIGAPRSGTTLLASMIGRHSDVAILIEDLGWSITKIASKEIVGNKLTVPNEIEVVKPHLIKKLFKKLKVSRYPVSDYSIEDYLALDHIRIIAIIRNGNAVISSIMKRGKKVFKIATYRWCRAIEIIYDLKVHHAATIMLLSFEDLVANPKNTMKHVAGFLELQFQEQMLEGYKYNPIYPNRTQIDHGVANKYSKQNIDFGLERRFPIVYKKYIELQACCNKN